MLFPGHLKIELSEAEMRQQSLAIDELLQKTPFFEYQTASFKGAPVADRKWTYCNLLSGSPDEAGYYLPDVKLSFDRKLWNTLPRTASFVDELCDAPLQVSILRLEANSRVGWHSHIHAPYHILQAPIVTNEHCEYLVRKSLAPEAPIERRVYRVGEIWRFDGTGFHDVKNSGTTQRTTLQIYVPLTDRRFSLRLNESLARAQS